jgi:uncharacterized protein (TIGR00251 family)
MPSQTTLLVHVQPRAKRSEVVGWHGDAVKVRVAAPPVDGQANEELTRVLAAALGVPHSAITVVAGASGRRKRVVIDGVSQEAVLHTLGLGETGSGHI